MGIGASIDPRPHLTRAALRLATLILVACVVGAVTCGCGSRLPPVSGCAPLTTRCTDTGRAEVCSSSRRWEPIGDSPCSAAGEVCVEAPRAHCAPMTITPDGGIGAR